MPASMVHSDDRLRSFNIIVKDYVGYKLRQKNIFLDGYNVNESPSAAACHLRRVADELIEENRQLFDSMCDQLHLTHASTYATFVGIADEIFQTGKNWGRIVAFLAFGATLAVYCVQKEDLAELLDNIIEWLSLYMEQNLGQWINENGGWVSNGNPSQFSESVVCRFINTLTSCILKRINKYWLRS